MTYTHNGKNPALFFTENGRLFYIPMYNGRLDPEEKGILNYLGDTEEDARETVTVLGKINMYFGTTFVVDNGREAYQFGRGWEEEQTHIFKSNEF